MARKKYPVFERVPGFTERHILWYKWIMTNQKTKVRDMTTGSPMVHILIFAVPLLIGNVFQQLYNMVDSLIVGNFVGADAIAAVGTCGSVNFLFFSLGNGIATGIGILVSQYFGAGAERSIKATIGNACYVLTAVSLVASVLGIALARPLLRWMDTPENILPDSATYMITTCAGMIFIALYNGIAAVLRALGDSRTPLYFLILSSLVNVGLDLLFVLNLGWGVFGVALATVISQATCALTALVYALKRVEYFKLSGEELRPRRFLIEKSFRLGVPIAFQFSMIAVSCIVLQGVINSFGGTVMAAATIISRIEQIIQQPYSSLSAALTTYAGQNMGARKIDRVKKGFRQSVLLVLAFSMLFIPIAYLFGEPIVGVFVKEAEVIAIGKVALRITSLCYFGLGMIYVPRAILNGCGDTGFAMINGVVEVLCRVIYSYILTSIPLLGFWGIWVTTGATWCTTAVVCLLRYASGVWKKKCLVEEQKQERCS